MNDVKVCIDGGTILGTFLFYLPTLLLPTQQSSVLILLDIRELARVCGGMSDKINRLSVLCYTSIMNDGGSMHLHLHRTFSPMKVCV